MACHIHNKFSKDEHLETFYSQSASIEASTGTHKNAKRAMSVHQLSEAARERLEFHLNSRNMTTSNPSLVEFGCMLVPQGFVDLVANHPTLSTSHHAGRSATQDAAKCEDSKSEQKGLNGETEEVEKGRNEQKR